MNVCQRCGQVYIVHDGEWYRCPAGHYWKYDDPKFPQTLLVRSNDAMYALLTSLNDAGDPPEVGGVAPGGGGAFVASLWDVDSAAEVHYTMIEADTGQVHCHNCAECPRPCGEPEMPAFPVMILLATDPDPSDTLEMKPGMVPWWRA